MIVLVSSHGILDLVHDAFLVLSTAFVCMHIALLAAFVVAEVTSALASMAVLIHGYGCSSLGLSDVGPLVVNVVDIALMLNSLLLVDVALNDGNDLLDLLGVGVVSHIAVALNLTLGDVAGAAALTLSNVLSARWKADGTRGWGYD